MIGAATQVLKVRRGNFASRAIVLLAAFAFALQSFVTQTHIHGGPQDFSGVAKIAAVSPAPVKAPLDGDSADCPFCQAVTMAGAFVVPALLPLCLPLLWGESVVHLVTLPALRVAAAHDWQSRGPPSR